MPRRFSVMSKRVLVPPYRRGDAALKRDEAGFQCFLGRVGQAGVDGAFIGKREAVLCVLGVVEHVGRGLVDGHVAGVGRPVERLARVQSLGRELPVGGLRVGLGVVVFRRHGNLG